MFNVKFISEKTLDLSVKNESFVIENITFTVAYSQYV